MKKILTLLMIIGLAISSQIQAQVSISTTCSDPDASAMLDVQSTDKGMLIPRMTATEMSNISSPATGLVVFNTTESKFYYYLPTTGWIPIDTDSNDGDAWGVTGEDQSSIIGRSGDVGIGTTTPDAKLEVVGKTIINRNNQDLSSYLPSLEGLLISNIGGTNGSYALRVVTDTDATPREGLIVTNAGNVGIGSISPSAKLEVNGGIDIDGNNVLEFGAGVSGKESNAGKIGYETFTPSTLDIVGAGTANNNRKIKFFNEGGAGFTGNVGIGTTNPNESLEVIGNIRMIDGNQGAGKVMVSDANGTGSWTEALDIGDGDAWAVTGEDQISAISRAGDVGIGTTNPQEKLHVEGGDVIILSDSSTLKFLEDLDDGNDGTGMHLTYDGTENELNFSSYSYNSYQRTVMTVQRNGHIGIGTRSPDQELHIKSTGNSDIMLEPENGLYSWDIAAENGTSGFNIANYDGSAFHYYMTILTDGNMGVGTRNPNETLEVNGSIRMTDGNQAAGKVMISDADGTGSWQDASTISDGDAWAVTGEDQTSAIGRTGNVGIGTTTPSVKLEITGKTIINRNNQDLSSYISSLEGLLISNIGSSNGSYALRIVTDTDATPKEGLVVTNSANVGIGTTNPGSKLDVNGHIRMTDGNEGAGKVMVSDANGTGSWQNASNINDGDAWGVAGEDQSSAIGRTGNVGIGTTTPSAKLEVNGGIDIDGNNVLEFGTGISGKEGNSGKIGYEAFTANTLDIIGAGTTNTNRKIKFWNEGGAGFNGSVGIGTTSPANVLHTVGGAVRFDRGGKTLYVNPNFGGSNTYSSIQYDADLGFRFYEGGDIRMDINEGGDVGIGTSSPLGKFHVFGNTGNEIAFFQTPDGVNANISIVSGVDTEAAADGHWKLGTNDDGKFHIRDAKVATNRLIIDPNGYVGIGVANPTYRLQLPNNADESGRGRANAWYTYSDSRLKTEQTTINYGLQTIMQLQPKRYNQHTANFENGSLVLSQDSKEINNTIGFIAQELNKVVPEATYQPEDESKDLWSVDYEKIIPILVKAVQELKTENDALKFRLNKLEK